MEQEGGHSKSYCFMATNVVPMYTDLVFNFFSVTDGIFFTRSVFTVCMDAKPSFPWETASWPITLMTLNLAFLSYFTGP